MPYQPKDLVTPSEIARYIYCQRAWWYDRQLINVRRRPPSSPLKRRLTLVAGLLAVGGFTNGVLFGLLQMGVL